MINPFNLSPETQKKLNVTINEAADDTPFSLSNVRFS